MVKSYQHFGLPSTSMRSRLHRRHLCSTTKDKAPQMGFAWQTAWQQWWDVRSKKVTQRSPSIEPHIAKEVFPSKGLFYPLSDGTEMVYNSEDRIFARGVSATPLQQDSCIEHPPLGELEMIYESQEGIFVPGVKAMCIQDSRLELSKNSVRVALDIGRFRKFCEEGDLYKACRAADLMDQQGFSVSTDMLHQLLQECTNNKNLDVGRQVHSLIRRSKLESDTFLGSYLIRMFALCGSLSEASSVFNKVSEPNVFTWSAIILAHAKHGQGEQALKLYYEMQQSGVKPDEHVFVAALKACTSLSALKEGKRIHSCVIECVLELDEGVGSALIDMYAKCGSLMEACAVFDKLQKGLLLPWNVMITGYVQYGDGQQALGLFHQMLQENFEPNHVTFLNTLKACSSIAHLEHGKLVHGDIVESGFESGTTICNTLIDMYSKCGSVEDACRVFEKLPSRDVVSWNAMISGLALQHSQQALCLFEQMQQEGTKPNNITYVNILKAYSTTGAVDQGKLIHTHASENGFESDVIVGSSLMDMYAKCGSLKDARRIFDKLLKRDVVAWNAMIAGYAQYGQGQEALQLFQTMLHEGKKPDDATLVSILKACSSVTDIDQGKSIHTLILKSGFKLDVAVGSTLMNMYIKFGNIGEARRLFDKMLNKDVVTWNALFTGYVQHGQPEEALQLFHQMQNEGTEPNNITYVSLLKACSSIVALEKGKRVHGHIIESRVELDDFVGNALVDMYAKCGHLDGARKVFGEIPRRSVVAWSAMIAGYALRSNYKVALRYFEDMQREGLKPDDVAFVNLLSACSHKGLVQEGCHHFKSMIEDHGITPVLEHYTCMADLLSRAGRLIDAEAILKSMPCQSSVVGWMSLLSNCRTHGKVEIGRRCFDRIVAIDYKYAAAYVVMSNIYKDAGMQEEADKIEEMREHAQAWKMPGKALVEVESQVHAFMVGDQSHPRSREIYTKLKTLAMEVHGGGHVPHLHSVQQVMSDEDKEDALCGHCEKLAIAFGLIATPKGTVIRVSKNLRVCSDCHNATKIISKIEDREIIVRDSYRIHHFKNGVCSCDDYV